MKTTWNQSEGVELCRKIEAICPNYGYHVAMSGGVLYKDGERKDLDLIFYRIRQWESVDAAPMFEALNPIGIAVIRGFGFCFKAEYKGKKIDCLFPEEDGHYLDDDEINGDDLANLFHENP